MATHDIGTAFVHALLKGGKFQGRLPAGVLLLGVLWLRGMGCGSFVGAALDSGWLYII